MFANWKSAVYEYAQRRNRLEIEGDAGEQLMSIVRDDRFVRKLDVRLRRMKAGRKARRAEPLRSETGLKIRNTDDFGQEAYVELEFRRSMEYGQEGQSFREDRMDVELLKIAQRGKQWIIAGVEPMATERRGSSAAPPPFVQTDQEEPDPSAGLVRPAPFLSPLVSASSGFRPVSRVREYEREKARRYAEKWWNGTEPQYAELESDCTNFVSQCLFAGGAPMNYTGKRESGWWYQGKDGSKEYWSYSWAVAHSLQAFLTSSKGGLRADVTDSPHKLAIGDVICYDWDGDGRFQHNAIVTGFDAAGMPLVNAHTTNSRMRYWDYRDSYAWTPNTRYRFLHIADSF
ncbi:amidase domain-containing protein [Paenibacillus hodogayensis]|uniref:Amidase domain-containing protein n=1 Tax=Paenibacillus hodogayensis TaxID=279208 RepID=A0ABV5W692_9BACL